MAEVMRMAWAELDGYVVVDTRPMAVAVRKSGKPDDEWTWVPRSACMDGETLSRGDTDIVVQEWMAEQKNLDWS